MYRYKLNQYLIDCPVPWQNFVNSIDFGENDHFQVIVKELKRYNAVAATHTLPHYIEFGSPEDITAFVLKWS